METRDHHKRIRKMRGPYGYTMSLDLKDCNPSTFTRQNIIDFLKELCKQINMQCEDLHFWDYVDPEEKAEAPPHLKGTSAVQFIKTSSIVIHTLDDLKAIYLDVFSCKSFSQDVVVKIATQFFSGEIGRIIFYSRG